MKKILALSLTFLLAICSITFISCGQKTARSSYEIECKLVDNLIEGKEKVTFYNNTENSFTSLKFNLFANAFREEAKYKPIADQYYNRAYYSGESYGDMQILKAYDQKEELEFNVVGEDQNVLEVNLNKEIFPEESVTIFIEYTITLANVIARTGIGENTINLANFYPILCGINDGAFYECVYYASGDPYFSDCADYLVTLSCSEEYIVASSGEIKSSKVEDSIQVSTYKIDNARSFCMVLSKDFEILSDKVGDVEINYYFYNDSLATRSLQTAKKSMEYFQNTFGEYPYKKYSVVQTDFIQGGMEFPALVMISDDLEESAYNEVIVHETAHQWWQTAVGNNEIEYGFLDEGLTEYSVILFYENHPEYSLSREMLINQSEKTYKLFCSVYDKLFLKVDTSMLRSLKDFTSEYEYVNVAYIKPCIMFDNLRITIGEEKFFASLKDYYEEYKFKNATPDDLVSRFENRVGEVHKYFNSFFEGKEVI
ncbi:MAG: M1 family metallopeptidase [Clostridia bacterium]|nr:M1 family metallopeptidase [Clostridia bacterium]